MEIVNSVFRLPESVVSSAVLTGTHLKIQSFIDPDLFQKVYKTEISATGLTPEKAFYLAMKVNKTPTPTPRTLISTILK